MSGTTDGEEELPPPVYPDVEAWVLERFVPMYRRPLGGEHRWCYQWWRHAEAISRLTLLWHKWELMRLKDGIDRWYRDHLDHHMPILMSARGPFYQCTEKEHLEPHIAHTEAAPLGWWSLPPEEDEPDDPP